MALAATGDGESEDVSSQLQVSATGDGDWKLSLDVDSSADTTAWKSDLSLHSGGHEEGELAAGEVVHFAASVGEEWQIDKVSCTNLPSADFKVEGSDLSVTGPEKGTDNAECTFAVKAAPQKASDSDAVAASADQGDAEEPAAKKSDPKTSDVKKSDSEKVGTEKTGTEESAPESAGSDDSAKSGTDDSAKADAKSESAKPDNSKADEDSESSGEAKNEDSADNAVADKPATKSKKPAKDDSAKDAKKSAAGKDSEKAVDGEKSESETSDSDTDQAPEQGKPMAQPARPNFLVMGGVSPMSAQSVNLGDMDARVANLSETGGTNCLSYASRSGSGNPGNYSTSGPTAWVGSSGEAYGGHGYPTFGSCYTGLSMTGSKSAVGITPTASNTGVDTGTTFTLGQVTHYNNSISGSTSQTNYFSGDLQLRLSGFTANPNGAGAAILTFPWTLWETSNQGSNCPNGQSNYQGVNSAGCADRIKFDSQISTVVYQNGTGYKMVIDGFVPKVNGQCVEEIPEHIDNVFWTAEGDSTTACIYGSMVQIRSLTVTKKVENTGNVTIPGFKFGSNSNLDGSPWKTNSTFTLNPTKTASDSVTREILEGEDVTIDEAIPQDWKLSSVECTGLDASDYSVNLDAGTLSIGDTPAAGGTTNINCTFTNAPDQFQDLTVTKKAKASYTADYDWSILKEAVDNDRIEVPYTGSGQTQAFAYKVTVTPSAPTYSDFAVTGSITVKNPNDRAVSGVNVTDSLPGADCTVTNGSSATISAKGSKSFAYSCDLPSDTAIDATFTNTAKASWSAANYPGSSGSASGTAPADFIHATVTTTDESVTLTDSSYDFGNGGRTLHAADGAQTFNYTISWPVKADTCADHPNTASIANDENVHKESTEVVEICSASDLDVSKNVVESFDRTYLWDIDKSVDHTKVSADPETGNATFNYTVTVTPKGSQDGNWAMSGAITVKNPNDWLDITADITDEVNVGGGATCTVDGGEDAVIEAGKTETFNYQCTFDSQPAYEGVNTATATWSETLPTPSSMATGHANVDKGKWSVTPINKTITVVDDKTDTGTDTPAELGTYTWNAEGTAKEFTYSLTKNVKAGTCGEYTNVATISETGQTASVDTEACRDAGLTVTKTADTSFDRTYLWQIDKSVDKTTQTISNGSATFNYEVTATPDGYVDSNWAASGQITVTNNNDFESANVTVSDSIAIGDGASCTVTDPTKTIAASESAIFDYTCSFTEKPSYTGTNTATVISGDQTFTGEASVTFKDPVETDKTVSVMDDKTDPANPVVLGSATWNSDGTAETFNYELALDGVAGKCTPYTNTAWAAVEGEDPSASQKVEVCETAGLDVTKDATATFYRTYGWDLDKNVDQTTRTVDSDSGAATFHYTVDATPGGYTDSNWAVVGNISIYNPNNFVDAEVTVADVLNTGFDTECTVYDDGAPLGPNDTITVPREQGTTTIHYACDLAEQPATAQDGSYEQGLNTATVTWNGTDYTGTADVNFGAPSGELNKTVTVTDDKTDPSNPVELGEATWNADGTPTPFEYDLTLSGTPGTCTPYTNTATLEQEVGEDLTASQDVNVCVEAAPSATKTANASFNRDYHWDIKKTASDDAVEIAGDTATIGYTVEAIENGFTDSKWAVDGTITVKNPNDFESIDVKVADVLESSVPDSMVECSFYDANDNEITPDTVLTIAKSGKVEVTYECSVKDEPSNEAGDYAEATNKAVVTWTNTYGEDVTTTATAPVNFELDHTSNKSVDVYDDQTDPENPQLLFTATWGDKDSQSASYDLDLTGTPGKCETFTNTAWVDALVQTPRKAPLLEGSGPKDGQPTASSSTVVCVEEGLTIAKTVEASYDRTYDWKIDKSVEDTDVSVDESGQATYQYTVDAVPDGFKDSNWKMSGTITVANPNEYEDGAIEITKLVNATNISGVTCTIDGDTNVTIAPKGQQTFNYDCDFTDGGPTAHESQNEATVSWVNADGETATAKAETKVTFDAANVTGETVEVWDDQTNPDEPVDLGEANWDDEESQSKTYELTFQGVGGKCLTFTNTAWLTIGEEAGPSDSADVDLCATSNVTIDKTVTNTQQLPDGTWQIDYAIAVTNNDGYASTYSLADTLEFGEGLTPLSASWSRSDDPLNVNGAWSDLPDNAEAALATDETIGAETTYTYNVQVVADAATSVIGTEEAECASESSEGSGGFLNSATVTSGEDSHTSSACSEPAAPKITKKAGDVTDNSDGTWTVDYTVTVKNPSEVGLFYDLSDTPGFAEGITIESGAVTAADKKTPAPNGTWNGTSDTTVATGVQLPAGSTHTYAVSAVVSFGDYTKGELDACDDGAGHGLYNSASLTSGNDSYDDAACADVPKLPDVNLAIVKAHSGGDDYQPGQAVTYTLSVSNTSKVDATDVVVTDVLPANMSVDTDAIKLPEGWTVTQQAASGDHGATLIFSYAKVLGAGDEVTLTYTSTVATDAPAGDQTNTATVTTETPEPDLSDNKSQSTITVSIPEQPAPPVKEQPVPPQQPATPEKMPSTGANPAPWAILSASLIALGLAVGSRKRRKGMQR